jgi:hypothetical protein
MILNQRVVLGPGGGAEGVPENYFLDSKNDKYWSL